MLVRKLIKNGEVILDGTETEEEKEKIIFLKQEIIQDYEEEFGLDIVFVLTALKKDTIYIKNKKGIYVRHHLSFKKLNNQWCLFFKSNHYVLLSDYRKTWALKKEDLKNEKDYN